MRTLFPLLPLVLFASGVPMAASSEVPDLGELTARMARFDQRVEVYAQLRTRAETLPASQPRLPLPEAPARLGTLDEDYLGYLSRGVLQAVQARVLSERDRGFAQWDHLYLPPRRVQLLEPRQQDGSGAWSRAIFLDWDQTSEKPGGLPDLGALLSGLSPNRSHRAAASGGPKGTDEDRWGDRQRALEDAIGAASSYPMRFAQHHGQKVWSNSGHWCRILERAQDAASACLRELEQERGQVLAELAGSLATLGQALPPAPETAVDRDAWDRRFDQAFLAELPLGIRWAVERRLAGAYFLGAWQAKQARLGWWDRFPQIDSQGLQAEKDRLGEAKRSFQLSGEYHYTLEAAG